MSKAGRAGSDLEAQLDALFASPLADFTGARNALAKSLDAAGRRDDAARVKALKKPSAAAWAVNALALGDRNLLDALVASGERLRKNPSDVRDAMRVRREALNAAAKAAENALVSSGHKPNPDVQRRISATLEAIAAYAGARGGPEAGRLSEDVPAPGFDEIASLGLLGGGAGARRAAASPSRKTQPAELPKASSPSKKDLARARALEEKRRRDDAKRAAALRKGAQDARARLAAAERALEGARRLRTALEEKLAAAKAEESRLASAASEARAAHQTAESALTPREGGR